MSIKYLFIIFGALLVLAVSCTDEDNPVVPLNDDTTPPADITDLTVIDPTSTSLTLSWTAPGDDDMIAEADHYDIRYSTSMITDLNWASATQVSDEPEPTVGKAQQIFTVTGLTPVTTYYFAIKTADEVPNWSGLSNVAGGTTQLAGDWTVYTTSNSDLPSDTINDIAIEGLIDRYFATAAGLGHFDGTNWTIYDISNSAIISNTLTAVAVDVAGTKWIGSSFSGVSKFDSVYFDSITDSTSGLTSNAIRAIVVDNENSIWFGTADRGLCKFDGVDWTYLDKDNSDIHSNFVTALAFDDDGNLWIGFSLGGVDKYDGNFVHYNADGALTLRAVTSIAAEGNIMWFGTEVGVFRYNGSAWTDYSTTNSGLAANLVLSVAVDGGGGKWFGTENYGLSRFSGSTWTTYNTSNCSLPNNVVRSLQPDLLGNLWIGTEGGVAVFND